MPEKDTEIYDAFEDLLGSERKGEISLIKKVCIIGNPTVGKTSLIRQYVYSMFDDKYLSTIGAKVVKKVLKIKVEEKIFNLKLMIWDIAGQKDFDVMKPMYYKDTEGVLVVCDITRRDTLDVLKNWIDELYRIVGWVPIVCMVNKIDLINWKDFDLRDAEIFLGDYHAPVFPTSAKTGENVEKTFHELGLAIVNNYLKDKK